MTEPSESQQDTNPLGGSELASKASVIVISKAIGGVTRIAGIAVLARLLTKPHFGLFSFALLTYLAVTTLAQLGLPGSVF